MHLRLLINIFILKNKTTHKYQENNKCLEFVGSNEEIIYTLVFSFIILQLLFDSFTRQQLKINTHKN